ncbi:hypothetical protein BDR07DRAFT_1479560 [Suillus spraguei]|nr:hypothetical protein BDR07DRAFT_1479560 [Suillus spraguei]
MDTPVHPRLRRKAKDQALENPVWGALQKKRTRKRERSPIDDIAPIPKRVRAKPVSKSDATKARTPAPLLRTENSKSSKRPPPLASDSEDNVEVSQPGGQRRKVSIACSHGTDVDIDSDDASKQSASDRITDIEESDSDSEPVESIAEALFGESPTPPPPVWGSQFKSSSAKEKKYAAEVPMWDSPMTRSSFGPQPLKRKTKILFDIKPEPSMSESSHADPMANLVYTKTGSVRLTDQNVDLRKVIQHGILEVKAYIAFKHGYPELAAKHHKTVPIEKRMYVDDEYLLALANLIDARASLFRTDIKDVAYKCAPGYFRLSHNCDAIIDRLLASHSYIFPQIFDAEGLPSPKRQKPYKGSLLSTLYTRYSSKTRKQGHRPEVPIPMVAIVSTAIHATLIAKKNKAGDDFKFTGNQFCDIYTYHVALLEKIRRTLPSSFIK